MKKSLICAAVALTCSPAMAGDVQLFGFFDQGISFLSENLAQTMGGPVGGNQAFVDPVTGKVGMQGRKNNISQGTGNVSTWGIRLTEELDDDLSVGVHLESGFLADSGELYNKNIFFERESTIAINSKQFGQLKLGRMPAMMTGSGTTGIFNSRVNPFGAGWGNMTGGWKFVGTLATARFNNMINYRSPSFNGVTLHAQTSFGDTNSALDAEEGSSKVNHYNALGVTVQGDRYFLAAGVDYLKMGSKTGKVTDDSMKALIGGHYDFGSFKAYATVQYMDNIEYIGGYSTKEYAPLAKEGDQTKGFDAWAVSLGADTKVWGGTAKFSVGYAQGENQNLDDDKDFSRLNVGVGYLYPLSKRTSVYGIGGYFWEDADFNEDEIYASEVIVGLMHRF
ncbi:MAG TPA: porin [Candidatus Aphodousia faecigallinarum]|uniref:Porin n=1 Tax=Candidatus Aphodousia faecigallinarum TaxID=2840677 RepID=A0A9D1LFC0_9BURK|nr:porin [Candidatus Aphodousia faecigallinarum]